MRAASLAVLALAGCREGGAEAFTPGTRVEFRTRGSGDAWQGGEVGTIGPCRVIFVPSPPPPEPAQRYHPVYPDSVRALRVPAGAPDRWRSVSAAAVRRRFGGCSPL